MDPTCLVSTVQAGAGGRDGAGNALPNPGVAAAVERR